MSEHFGENSPDRSSADARRQGGDVCASERAERMSAERVASSGDEQCPADGWGRQPIANYVAGDSGGWGGPVHDAQTGPNPRLRPESPAGRSATAGEMAHSSRAAATEEPSCDASDVPEESATGTAQPTTQSARPSSAPHRPTLVVGRAPRSFERRVTLSLAPIAFWLIVAWLLLDYARGIYQLTTPAAQGLPTDPGAVVVSLVVGLVQVVALACLARLGLEACTHLAELADSRRADTATSRQST